MLKALHPVQELISGLNRRLDQLQSHASRAQDESGNLRQRVAVLNAQHEILQRENQRLLHESTEHSTARWQLVAQRDAADRMSQQLQDQESSQRARLHSELTTLQRDLAEVQRQLAEERSSHQHSFSSVQTVQEAADARYNLSTIRSALLIYLSKAVRSVVVWCRCEQILRRLVCFKLCRVRVICNFQFQTHSAYQQVSVHNFQTVYKPETGRVGVSAFVWLQADSGRAGQGQAAGGIDRSSEPAGSERSQGGNSAGICAASRGQDCSS